MRIPIIILALLLLTSCTTDWTAPIIVDTDGGGAGCGHFICGNDAYTGGGNLSGKSWSFIEGTFAKNYHNNTKGWNQTQTFVNSSVTVLWMPWYESSSNFAESNLKDTYTQSAYGVNATWTINTVVTDESSELSMASVMNWSNIQLRQFMNYLDLCADSTAGHGTWLTSWVCSRNNTVITKNDQNSASDASSRLALTMFMACQNPQLDSANRSLACARAINISNAMVNEEFVQSCQNSSVNTSAQLCSWRLAGAAQAWGPGALTQVGQQMFFGYHESDIMALLAAYANTHDERYSSAARNETHQFLYVAGFRNAGNTSAHFNITVGGAHYYMDCATTPTRCIPKTTSSSVEWDDSDATRAWETCSNVHFANVTYTKFGEPLPWEFAALRNYCTAWAARMGPAGVITVGGTNFANTTSACYRINNTNTCGASGIVGLNSYKPAGWVSNMVAYLGNESYYNTFAAGSLSTYSNVSDTFGSDTGFGVYGPIRYLRSIRTATGYYDFLFMNQSFNYTGYVAGTGSYGAALVTPSSDSVFSGPINLTVRSPINGSVSLQNSVYFNLSVWNLNNTDIGTVGNATKAVCTFTDAASSCNATGGTLNTTTGVYEDLANYQTWTIGPFNQSNYSWFNFSAKLFFVSSTNGKLFPLENASSTAGDHYLFGMSSSLLRVRDEPGYSKSCPNLQNNSWLEFSFVTNRTNNTFGVHVSGCSWYKQMTYMNNASADYLRFETGGSNTYVRMDNLTFQVPLDEAGGGTTPGNSTMNVTIYYGNGTVIYQQNGTTNGTNIGYNLTGLANGNYTWYVTIRSKDNVVNYTGLNFSVAVPPPDTTPPSFTVVNDSVTNSSFRVTSVADEASNMSIKYGNTTALGSVINNVTSATTLTLNVTGLNRLTTYYYNVTRCDSLGNCNTTGPHNVTTVSGIPGLLTTVTLCPGVQFRLIPVGTGLINYSTLVYNTTVCTFKVNASLETTTVTVSARNNINSTNRNRYITQFGGVNLTNVSQTIVTVPPGGVAYFNVTGYWNNSLANRFLFNLTVSVN
jgi:hypothetical protein